MNTPILITTSAALLAGAALLTGCGGEAKKSDGAAPAAAGGAKQELCPVSGEKLGSMGKPYEFEYKGRKIQLCCDGCKEDFDKEPEKYAAKLPK